MTKPRRPDTSAAPTTPSKPRKRVLTPGKDRGKVQAAPAAAPAPALQPPAPPKPKGRNGRRPGTGKGKRPNTGATSPGLIKARQMAQEALTYRMMGHTYATIADVVGYNSPQAAREAVRRELDKLQNQLNETAEELRTVLLQRLEMIAAGSMSAAMNGDGFAAETVMKALDRTERLVGLNKPIKVAATTPDGEASAATLSWADLMSAAQTAPAPAPGQPQQATDARPVPAEGA